MPVSPIKDIRESVKDSSDTGDSTAAADEASAAEAAHEVTQPLLVNRLMKAKGFRTFSARTVAVVVKLMQQEEYFFVNSVLPSPVTKRLVSKPKVWYI